MQFRLMRLRFRLISMNVVSKFFLPMMDGPMRKAKIHALCY